MKEPQDAGKYQVNSDGTVQGQVTGDNNKVEIHIHNPQDKAPSSTKPQRVWNIPYLRNDYFTGREEILVELHARFKANNATALSQRIAMSGLGGIGKTQTAVEYAYRYHEEYQAVLWTRAESHEALTSSFVEIAALLDLPQKDAQDQTIVVQAVKRWLQDNTGWLLILDNADEPAIVREFLPTKFDGHILLTTRAQALGGLAQRIEVDTFTPELGAMLLLRRAMLIGADDTLELATPEDREMALQISEELGGLPLVLDQAGAYIEETQCSLLDYLSLYRTQRTEILKERGGLLRDHPDSVATTWSLSFQRVEEKNAAAADLLRFCAFLAPDAIPEEIITKGTEHLGPSLQAATSNPMLLNKAIAALGAYSLVRRDPVEKTLSIHRLVQAVLQDAMSDDETKLWAERTVLAVSKACPEVEFTTWAQWERYLPHALVCTDLIRHEQMIFSEAVQLLNRTGHYLSERARYREAEPLLQSALATLEKSVGPQHQDTAQSLAILAALYNYWGKYTKAEPLLQQALVIDKQLFGSEHPKVATDLNNLAETYTNQRKYIKAQPLFQQALDIYEQELGPMHPYTANCLNNLAVFNALQGEIVKAEQLLQRTLIIYEQELGPMHPYTAHSLNNLAELYHMQGKVAESEKLFLRALTIWEQIGTLHPGRATSLSNLAFLSATQGKYVEAEPLYAQALVIYRQQLGSEHPNTQQARQNYAALLRAMGRHEEAKYLEEKQ